MNKEKVNDTFEFDEALLQSDEGSHGKQGLGLNVEVIMIF